jgi:hypothetical protein
MQFWSTRVDLPHEYCCARRNKRPVFVFAALRTIMRTPHLSRWSYGLLGSLGRRHARTPCDFGFIRPRNVRCHQGHWSRSWPVWPQIEVYRVETPVLHETELGGVFRPRPLEEITSSFSQCTSSYYELLHHGNAIVNSPSGLDVKTPPDRILGVYFA